MTLAEWADALTTRGDPRSARIRELTCEELVRGGQQACA